MRVRARFSRQELVQARIVQSPARVRGLKTGLSASSPQLVIPGSPIVLPTVRQRLLPGPLAWKRTRRLPQPREWIWNGVPAVTPSRGVNQSSTPDRAFIRRVTVTLRAGRPPRRPVATQTQVPDAANRCTERNRPRASVRTRPTNSASDSGRPTLSVTVDRFANPLPLTVKPCPTAADDGAWSRGLAAAAGASASSAGSTSRAVSVAYGRATCGIGRV